LNTYYQDADGDEFGDPNVVFIDFDLPDGFVCNRNDCNDNDPNINPAVDEVCDGVDNNCDGEIDEGCPPEIICPTNIKKTVSAKDKEIEVTYEATVNDYVDPDLVITYDPASGSKFPVGTTTVTVIAANDSGNTSQCTFTVTVTLKEKPALWFNWIDQTSLWSNNYYNLNDLWYGNYYNNWPDICYNSYNNYPWVNNWPDSDYNYNKSNWNRPYYDFYIFYSGYKSFNYPLLP